MKKLFYILLFLQICSQINAQKSAILEKYIAEGLENSLALKQEKLEIEKALNAITIAKSNFSPRITFAPTYTLAAGGRKLSFPIGDLLNPVYSTLNALTKSSHFPQVENVNQLLAPNNFQETKLSFQYPIFNPEAKYNVAIQKELLQTEYAKKKVLEYELKNAIELAYLQYLTANAGVKLYENAKKTLQDVEKLNQKLINNDMALKDGLLAAQYEVIKMDQEIENAKKNITLSQYYVNFLLNKPFESTLVLDTLLLNASKPSMQESAYYVAAALQNRPEFNQLDQAIRTTESVIVLQEKSAKLPNLFIGGNAGFQGFGYHFLKNQAFTVVQAGLNYELYHGQEKKKKIEQAKISKSIVEIKREEAQRQISMQVQQAYLEAKNAQNNLSTYAAAKEKTRKILDIVTSRYNNGKAIYLELSKAQNDHLQTLLMEQLAQHDFLSKYSNLKKSSAITE
jgi:outer membrane protein